MATLNAAVQQMIDKLHAALATGTMSAEDQLLVGKALEALQSSTTWEKALIAVAEEHLNTGTTALNSARTLLDAAKATLDSSRDVLNAQAANLALIPTVSNAVMSAKSSFLFSGNACDAFLSGPSESTSNLPRIAWTLSLDDYETGTFTSLSASHDPGSGAASNPYIVIAANGNVSSSLTSLQVAAGSAALLPSTNGSVRLFNINTAYNSCLVCSPHSNTSIYSFPMSVPRLYLDPATRIAYAAYGGKLYKATDSGAAEVAPAVDIADANAFDNYAIARGWLRVDGLFAPVSNQGITNSSVFSAGDINTSTAEVSADVGATGASAYSFLSFDPTQSGTARLERITFQGSNKLHITSDALSTAGYYAIRSALLRARFRFGARKFREMDIDIRPKHVAPHTGRSNSILTPSIISASFMHNAVIARFGFIESNHGGYRTFTGLSFGR